VIFSSYPFLLFLLLTVGLYYVLEPHSYRVSRIFLLVASLVFYAWWRPADVPFFIGSVLFNFAAGSSLQRMAPGSLSRSLLLTAGIAGNLLALGWFKYAGFLADAFDPLFGGRLPEIENTLPLAISFFTFTQIAYLVDAYRQEVPRYGVLDYALFVAFFPHLIAGPIVHHNELLPQLTQRKREHPRAHYLAIGVTLFTIGLAKKVLIADNMAPFADNLFEHASSNYGMIESWTGALAYSMQIYFDFSGYSDMACGASYMFGFKLPINFFSPYKAASIIEFWRRWHITLSRFLRDFLYVPLGGNRKGAVRRYVNLMITMLLGGLWHGAGWTFVIWGGLHGLYLVINHAINGLAGALRLKLTGVFWIASGWLVTQLGVTFAWVFFRAASFQDAGNVMRAMVGLNGAGDWMTGVDVLPAEVLESLGRSSESMIVALAVAAAILLPNSVQLMRNYAPFLDPTNVAHILDRPGRFAVEWRPNAGWASYTTIILCFSLLSLLVVSPFLYFQF
jgi:D-alanyl-lipoteichoic acid acyltransferase DltB (MBOAT superfamily)